MPSYSSITIWVVGYVISIFRHAWEIYLLCWQQCACQEILAALLLFLKLKPKTRSNQVCPHLWRGNMMQCLQTKWLCVFQTDNIDFVEDDKLQFMHWDFLHTAHIADPWKQRSSLMTSSFEMEQLYWLISCSRARARSNDFKDALFGELCWERLKATP